MFCEDTPPGSLIGLLSILGTAVVEHPGSSKRELVPVHPHAAPCVSAQQPAALAKYVGPVAWPNVTTVGAQGWPHASLLHLGASTARRVCRLRVLLGEFGTCRRLCALLNRYFKIIARLQPAVVFFS